MADYSPTRAWYSVKRQCIVSCYVISVVSSNGFLTWVSVSMSEVATSKRLGLDRYLLSLNWFSNSSSCWLVNAVLGLLHFPNNPACAEAEGQKQRQTQNKSKERGYFVHFPLFTFWSHKQFHLAYIRTQQWPIIGRKQPEKNWRKIFIWQIIKKQF